MSGFTNLTLPQKLMHWARERPHEVALRQKDFGIWNPVTWAAYAEAARHFGLGLMAMGTDYKKREGCAWQF